ncbi:cation:proton antiporter [Gloeocapsopsis dulcis]|uniref:Sodium:proton antiporter n=1 Tax=Gloeocapsopsis dulcis AAB1 = 1H9 TaxID=1433147 RepID=A0A6N8FZZ5_9CHRO|nr:cation:proton antiporter [Gloeocapsopsis dulcis]MUL38531.1 sodium:proton antiporter [Gloeocapsopsis dulcis AAB1 = 1H9]WNN90661.1 cation:proton antiporter [Gloeocapsopsis dulcis]
MSFLAQIFAVEPISEVLTKEPIVPFVVLLIVILVVPILFERLQLPGLIGLLVAGVVLGPNVLNIFQTELPTIRLLSNIGLVYLMFVAGLEVDMEQFRRTRNKSLGFGTFTFLVPLIVGTLVGRVFGFGWNASILIGSLFASHTLLAYPIISRLGVINNEAVTVTIGATIFTDIGALLVLAVCVAIHAGEFTALSFITLLGSLFLYSAAVLIGFDWVGKEFFRRSGDEEGKQFLFVLLAVFLAAVGAQLIGVEKIIGAFLAGLAVNDVVGEGPVKEKVVFVGSVLFIPIFFIDLGLLINIPAFVASISNIWLTLAIVVGLVSSKFIAAFLAKLIYRYNWLEALTMWSLSIPQVGATLAATLVGYRAGLLNEGMLNSVIVLMLVTATLGPLLTSRVAVGLMTSTVSVTSDAKPLYLDTTDTEKPLTVVVPVYNPDTEQYLIEMAALIARQAQGRLVPLAIASGPAHMDAPQLESAMAKADALLDKATTMSHDLGVTAESVLRIDDAIAPGITRASREQNANLIVMGWGKRTGFRARLFGNVIDSVLWTSHCPVAVTRLLESPTKVQRILVPVQNFTPEALRPLRFALLLATAIGAQVTLLNVCDRRIKPSSIAWNKSNIELLVSKLALPQAPVVEVVPHESIAQAIMTAAKAYDLVVLRSIQRRTSAGGLAVSDLTSQLVAQLSGSIVLLGEPQKSNAAVIRGQFLQRSNLTKLEKY